ncbi:IS701 family transposase [Sorangium sp. So ce233]|uniref:IS701 family transposase n=1 Tax=Sorangium sp. So ce233 TaxID=3133290 RepID=UPI003F60EA47
MEARAEGFLGRIGQKLRNKNQRASFSLYATGLLSTAERKSAEPIVALSCPDPAGMDAAHQRMLHFLAEASWDDRSVRLEATRYALEQIEEKEIVEAWIIDDTGFLKKGTHSVGVQRQYTGSAGKVTNCQVGVSLTLASPSHHVAADFELYLPDTWANDKERRLEARIPPGVSFKTKPELALDMIERAVRAKLPRGLVLADSAYGDCSDFRATLRAWELDYAVGVSKTLRVLPVGRDGEVATKAVTAQELSDGLTFRRVTWRQGSAGPLSARFAFARVVPARDDGWKPEEREVVHLVCEQRDGEDELRFHLTSLPADRLASTYVVRMLKQRWRTERVYQDLKEELGLDHYEGRRFQGWHHHVSVVLACSAFITAERAAFSPCGDDCYDDLGAEVDAEGIAGWTDLGRPQGSEANTSFALHVAPHVT